MGLDACSTNNNGWGGGGGGGGGGGLPPPSLSKRAACARRSLFSRQNQHAWESTKQFAKVTKQPVRGLKTGPTLFFGLMFYTIKEFLNMDEVFQDSITNS